MAAFYDLGVISNAPELLAAASHSSEMVLHGRWKELIPQDQWAVYQRVVDSAISRGIDIAFGGAFALATYTGKWRDTKDMDLYIRPQDAEKMKAALTDAGLKDYFEVKDYDRSWIYRSHDGEVIVDIIWSMANHRADVDRDWLLQGPTVEFGNHCVHVIPPEELIWSKLYVMQKDRSDWPDVLNLLHAVGPSLDWRRMVERLDGDVLLLDGVLSVFRWLAPERAAELPAWLWKLRMRTPKGGEAQSCARVKLLDSRPWFRPLEEASEPVEGSTRC